MTKTLVLSGGSSGIGLAIAERFDQDGFRVFNLDLQAGPVGETLICDLTDHRAVQTSVSRILEQCSTIDILVSNAGRHCSGTIEDTSESEFLDLFNLNVKGAYSLTQAVLPVMKSNKEGVIVYIGSDQSLVAKPHSFACNLSKHALASLAKTTALDYAAFNIRANIVCPGTIDTPLYQNAINRYCAQTGTNPSDVHRAEAAEQPLNRIGRPEEVASFVAYLATPDAAFITGSVLPIDGGYTAR